MDSESLKAAMTFRISPGAGISITSLIFPVLPPLSATVTIAVISMGNSLNPLAKTDKPVPPPISTTFICFIFYLHFRYAHLYDAHKHCNQKSHQDIRLDVSLAQLNDVDHLCNQLQ